MFRWDGVSIRALATFCTSVLKSPNICRRSRLPLGPDRLRLSTFFTDGPGGPPRLGFRPRRPFRRYVPSNRVAIVLRFRGYRGTVSR